MRTAKRITNLWMVAVVAIALGGACTSVNAENIALQTFDTAQGLKIAQTAYANGRGTAWTTYAGGGLGFVAAGWTSGSSAGPFEVSSAGKFYSGDTSGSSQALQGPGKYAPPASLTYPDVRRVTYALFSSVDLSGYDSSTLSLDIGSNKNGVNDLMFVRLYLDGSATGIDLLTIDVNNNEVLAADTTYVGGTLTYSFDDAVSSAELFIGFEADDGPDYWTLDNVSFDGTAVVGGTTTTVGTTTTAGVTTTTTTTTAVIGAETIASQTFDDDQGFNTGGQTSWTDGLGDSRITYTGTGLGFEAASKANPEGIRTTGGTLQAGHMSSSGTPSKGFDLTGKYAPPAGLSSIFDDYRSGFALFDTVDLSGHDSSTMTLDLTTSGVFVGSDDAMFVRLYLDGSSTGVDVLTMFGDSHTTALDTDATFVGGKLTYNFDDAVNNAELIIGFNVDDSTDDYIVDNVSFDGSPLVTTPGTLIYGK